MTGLLRAEVRKLVSVPSTWWLALATIAFATVTVLTGPTAAEGFASRPLAEREIVFIGTFHRILIVVLAARMMTDEHRFGLGLSTFTVTPRRGRVVIAKSVVGAATGATLGGLAMSGLIGAGLASGRIDAGMAALSSQAAAVVGGSALAGALWGVVGVAIGALLRNPTGASVAIVVWLLAAENLVASQLGRLGGYLPGQSGTALALAPSGRQALVGGLSLAAATAAGLVAAVLATQRRDVG